MNNKQVAHIWAQQNRPGAKGSHFFFEEETIYSYGTHFPIARFTKDAHGKKCILFTTRGYSVSTQKHIGYVSNALCGLSYPIHYVIDPREIPGVDDAEKMKVEAINSMILAGRARGRRGYLTEKASEFERDFFALCKAFKIKHKDARKRTILDEKNVERLKELAAVEAKAQAKERKRREQERAEEIEKSRAEWLSGEADHIPYYASEPVLLRIKEDKIETSRGATVPLDKARLLYAMSKERGIEAVIELRPEIGEFQITNFENGNIRAGCHLIPYSEVERVFSVKS